MMPGTRRFPRIALGLAAALIIAGCQSTAFLSGAGSMRIDIEVYKGPLSKDPNTQLGELVGLTKETRLAFERYRDLLRGVARAERDCYVPILQPPPHPSDKSERRKDDPDFGKPFKFGQITGAPRDVSRSGLENQPKNEFDGFCGWLAALDEQTTTLLKDGGAIDGMLRLPGGQVADDPEVLRALPDKLRAVTTRIAETAIRLKTMAAGWAIATAALMPDSYVVRISTSNFMVAAAEYANQLSSHADALLQQMAGVNRRELPISILLRDTTPTQFLNTYVWNRAVAPALTIDKIYRPGSAFSSEETRDRVRVVERLYDDHHWARINTAFATGQGDTSMAFIKDDIGNWNLKSFDNDPSELLQAYRNLGFAGLQMATEAIRGLATSGGSTAAASLLDTANRVALGRGAAPAQVGGVGIEALHKRTLDRLVQIKADAAKEQEALRKSAEEKASKRESARTTLATAQGKVADALAARPDGKSAEDHRKAAADLRAQSVSKSKEATGRRNDATAETAAGNTAKASQLMEEARALDNEATRLGDSAFVTDGKAAAAQAAEAKAESIRVADVVPAEATLKKAEDDLASVARDVNTLTARRVAEAVKLLDGHIDLIGLMEQSAAGASQPSGQSPPGGAPASPPAGTLVPTRPVGY